MKEVPVYPIGQVSICFDEDIEKVHGKEFMVKFNEYMRGSACPLITEEERPNEFKGTSLMGVYPWDYWRYLAKTLPTSNN